MREINLLEVSVMSNLARTLARHITGPRARGDRPPGKGIDSQDPGHPSSIEAVHRTFSGEIRIYPQFITLVCRFPLNIISEEVVPFFAFAFFKQDGLPSMTDHE